MPRAPSLTIVQQALLRELYQKGMSRGNIAKKFSVKRDIINGYIHRLGLARDRIKTKRKELQSKCPSPNPV